MIKVADKFLTPGYIHNLDLLCHSSEFRYTYTSEINFATSNVNLWDKQFIHNIIVDNKRISEHCGFFMPIIYQIEHILDKKIIHIDRLKVNMTTTVPDYNVMFGPHIDSDNLCWYWH